MHSSWVGSVILNGESISSIWIWMPLGTDFFIYFGSTTADFLVQPKVLVKKSNAAFLDAL